MKDIYNMRTPGNNHLQTFRPGGVAEGMHRPRDRYMDKVIPERMSSFRYTRIKPLIRNAHKGIKQNPIAQAPMTITNSKEFAKIANRLPTPRTHVYDIDKLIEIAKKVQCKKLDTNKCVMVLGNIDAGKSSLIDAISGEVSISATSDGEEWVIASNATNGRSKTQNSNDDRIRLIAQQHDISMVECSGFSSGKNVEEFITDSICTAKTITQAIYIKLMLVISLKATGSRYFDVVTLFKTISNMFSKESQKEALYKSCIIVLSKAESLFPKNREVIKKIANENLSTHIGDSNIVIFGTPKCYNLTEGQLLRPEHTKQITELINRSPFIEKVTATIPLSSKISTYLHGALDKYSLDISRRKSVMLQIVMDNIRKMSTEELDCLKQKIQHPMQYDEYEELLRDRKREFIENKKNIYESMIRCRFIMYLDGNLERKVKHLERNLNQRLLCDIVNLEKSNRIVEQQKREKQQLGQIVRIANKKLLESQKHFYPVTQGADKEKYDRLFCLNHNHASTNHPPKIPPRKIGPFGKLNIPVSPKAPIDADLNRKIVMKDGVRQIPCPMMSTRACSSKIPISNNPGRKTVMKGGLTPRGVPTNASMPPKVPVREIPTQRVPGLPGGEIAMQRNTQRDSKPDNSGDLEECKKSKKKQFKWRKMFDRVISSLNSFFKGHLHSSSRNKKRRA